MIGILERLFGKATSIQTETDKIPAEVIKTTSLTTAVGTAADEEDDNTLCGYMYTSKKHIHGRDRSYPFTGAGVTITGGTDASAFGAYTEIIPVLANEVNTLTITHAADASGNVVIDLNGKKHTCAILSGAGVGDTVNLVAAQLRALTYSGDENVAWTVTGSDATVIFTRAGISSTATFNDIGTTGVTATIVKTNTGAGVNKPFDIHLIQGGNANVKDTYIIEISMGLAGYEDRIGNIRVTSQAINASLGNIPFMTRIVPAGSRITGRIATVTGGEDTAVVSLNYHVY